MEMVNLENDKPEKWIKHYSSSYKILLVGEGNFSFAACLGRAFGSAANMVITSLDSREMLMRKYSGAMANLKKLEELGCTIMHEVDVNTMSQHYLLKLAKFDRILFNFPHAGFIYREHDSYQIELHKNVVKGFLRNAWDMLNEKGEVHITSKTAHPFNLWEIEKLGNEVGLRLHKVPFCIWDYPGYESKIRDGLRCDQSFPVGQCSTFKFQKPSYIIFS
ncbi:hypothetical protein DITRI_Ditri01bG0202000 [Diplodiscus trichospermus]